MPSARHALLIGLCLAASLSAQTPSSPKVFGDENGTRIRVTGWSSWSGKTLPDGKIRAIFKNPSDGKIVAEAFKDGITLKANSVTLILDKEYKLISAEMTGGISFTRKQPGDDQTVNVSAPKATYTAATRKVEVEGALNLLRKNESTDESLTCKGADGTVVLSEKGGDDAVERAEIAGPLTFVMKGFRVETNETTKKPEKLAYNLDGKAGRLVYVAADRVIRLTGGVNLSGNDPALIGDISGVSSATITLAGGGQIDSIEMEGDPGKTVIEQKGKGGKGGKRRR